MATSDDYKSINCYGGFVPNCRGTISFQDSMDIVDNPQYGEELKGRHNISVTQRSYPPPLPMKTGMDPLPHNCSKSESGFTRARSTHTPDVTDIFNVHRERVLMSSNPMDQVQPNCKVPNYMGSSVTHETFTKDALKSPKLLLHTHFPGSKESGFTHSMNPNTLDGRSMDPIWSGSYPDMGRMGPSVSHQDYLPMKLMSGKEFTQPLCYTGRTVTGFNRFHELNPCYSDHSWKGPCRSLDTSYNHDYYPKYSQCNTHGKEIVGKGFQICGNTSNMNLFDGPGYYISEAMDRYCSPVPEGRRRHANIHRTVDNFNQVTGFTWSSKIHNPYIDHCKMNDSGDGPLDTPTKYNPWPRHVLGYSGILNKSYRPHPVSDGTEYNAMQIVPGSIYLDFPALV